MHMVLDILEIVVPSFFSFVTIMICLFQIYHEEWTLVHRLKNVEIVLIINPIILSQIYERGESVADVVKKALHLRIKPLFDVKASIGDIHNVYYTTTVDEYLKMLHHENEVAKDMYELFLDDNIGLYFSRIIFTKSGKKIWKKMTEAKR